MHGQFIRAAAEIDRPWCGHHAGPPSVIVQCLCFDLLHLGLAGIAQISFRAVTFAFHLRVTPLKHSWPFTGRPTNPDLNHQVNELAGYIITPDASIILSNIHCETTTRLLRVPMPPTTKNW
jgi:hypothetical protein